MTNSRVAPHVGAWIEIKEQEDTHLYGCVAPHVGAWIEIIRLHLAAPAQGRTPRGCVD